MFYRLPLLVILLATAIGYGQDFTPCNCSKVAEAESCSAGATGCDESGGVCDCCSSHDDIRSREGLTGNWFERRTCLEEHGIEVESFLTQFYQGVASGGAEQIFRYGAKFDLLIDFDTEKLGLWRGGKLRCHAAEWQFGQNSIADAAFLAPVNLDQLAPRPEPSFGLTYLLLEQELSHGFAGIVGRYNLLDLWERFYPDYGLGLEGFMNVSLAVPFNAIVPALPSVSNVAGIVRPDERGLESGLLVRSKAAGQRPTWESSGCGRILATRDGIRNCGGTSAFLTKPLTRSRSPPL